MKNFDVLYIVYVVLCLFTTVIVHELGHYWFATKLGYSSIINFGIGKMLFKNKKIMINLLPLGAFVDSDILAKDLKGNYLSTKIHRQMYFSCGFLFNIIFGLFVCGVSIWLQNDLIYKLGIFNLIVFILNIVIVLPPNDIWNVLFSDVKLSNKNQYKIGFMALVNFVLIFIIGFYIINIVFF